MRYSKQRNLVLDILRNTDTHPTADWVYEKASEKLPGIGIATVYRNLHALVDAGEAAVIMSSGNTEHFDGRASEHVHLQCEDCGCIMDLHPQDGQWEQRLQEAIREVLSVGDAEISIGKTILQGRCRECAHKRKS